MIARKLQGLVLLCALTLGATTTNLLGQDEFPFDKEMLLDVRPMPGSKRIPNVDIAANGRVAIEMWCDRVDGQVVVAGDTITVITGATSGRACSPERARADAEFLAMLAEVTHWRRQGSIVTLVGPRTMRFRLLTN